MIFDNQQVEFLLDGERSGFCIRFTVVIYVLFYLYFCVWFLTFGLEKGSNSYTEVHFTALHNVWMVLWKVESLYTEFKNLEKYAEKRKIVDG